MLVVVVRSQQGCRIYRNWGSKSYDFLWFPSGSVGEMGPVGEPGSPGQNGLRGETGAQGPRGESGSTGPVGPQGAQGFRVRGGQPSTNYCLLLSIGH